MKQIIVWPAGALALASIFATPSQGAGPGWSSVGASQGQKISTSLYGAPPRDRRGSQPPPQIQPQPPAAKKLLSEEEKLQVLHQDAMAYAKTQGEKPLNDAAWVSWFIARYRKDETFAKLWLAKLKDYDKRQSAAGVVQPLPKLESAPPAPPPGVLPPPPPPVTTPVPPPLPYRPPVQGQIPPPLTHVPPLPALESAPPPPPPGVLPPAPPPVTPRGALPTPGLTTLKPAGDRNLPPPKPKEETPVDILSKAMEARRKAIAAKGQDVGETESSEEW